MTSDQPDTKQEPWWHEFFDDDYAAYGLLNTDPNEDSAIAEFIIRSLELKPGDTVFDQCCGVGRISLQMAARGMNVVGVDRVQSYVDIATREADKRQVSGCAFHCADAHQFVSPIPCDGAVNWFTSFGYSPDDEQNIRFFQSAFVSLKPGGRFMIDYMNVPRVLAELRPWYIDRPTAPALDGLIVLHETKPDLAAGMMNSDWTFLYPDGRRKHRRIATRMYLPSDIAAMLRRCGFDDVQLLGSREGEPLTLAGKRCIALARKPRVA